MTNPGKEAATSGWWQCFRRVFPLWLVALALAMPGVAAAADGDDFLTAQERNWLQSRSSPISVAPEGNYPPFSFMEAGTWQGISADMVRLLEKRLGTRVQVLAPDHLAGILARVKTGEVDVVTSLKETPERAQFLDFTPPYIQVPTAIIVKADWNAGAWPQAFSGKRVAVGKGYGVQAYLEQHFPSLALTLVPDDLEGMRKLSFGEVDAVIMDVASASFFIQKEKFTNLRLLQSFDYTYDLSLGVRKDLGPLRDILTKALAHIPAADRDAISARWISLGNDPLSLAWRELRQWTPLVAIGVLTLTLVGGMAWRTQRQRHMLERKSSRYSRSLIEASLDPLVTISPGGKITDVNSATERVTGQTRDNLIGSDFADYFTDPARARQGYTKVFALGSITNYPLAIRHTSGRVTDVLYNASLYRDEDGRVLGVFASARDVTEHKKAESLIQAASVFTYAREGIMITQADGTILNVNEAFTRITGYSRDEAIGQSSRLLNSGQHDQAFYRTMWTDLLDKGHWYGEIWNRRKNGELYIEALTITAVRGAVGNTEHYVALFSDITAAKEHQGQLEHLAHFDALTHLPNRLLLSDRLRQGLAHAERRNQTLAVVYLDLDGFKGINDQHGHDVGDQLLIVVAQRMKQALREADTLARLGGDEFIAVITDLADQAASEAALNRLLQAASQPVLLGERVLQVSASIGVTYYPQDQPVDADQLLRQADQAMYQAKLSGKGRIHVFDATHDSHIRVQHESLQAIRLALEQRQFLLHFQPKVHMRSGEVIGAEALIRWLHPQRGLLSPAEFLPALEGHPLAISVGRWVLETALAQVEAWQAEGLQLPVSVNLSAAQLQQGDFVEQLRQLLEAHPRVKPSFLELEIVETAALEDITQVSAIIDACDKMGVGFALDDFGTGYSSLTYLKRLRVRLLKIDQSFVRDMLNDRDDQAILQGVIGLAAALNRQVIAEGVETTAQGSRLLEMGCELAQGYGIARPMSGAEMPSWVAQWRTPQPWADAAAVDRT